MPVAERKRGCLVSERLESRYVKLKSAVLWDENPKDHDIGAMIQAFLRYGFRDAPIFDETKGCIVAGNGRLIALKTMRDDGLGPPRGVVVEGDEWTIPVQFGIDAKTPEEAEAFGIDHNNITLLGGNVSVDAIMGIWNEKQLKSVLDRVKNKGDMPISFDWEDYEAMRAEGDGAQPGLVPSGSPTLEEGQGLTALSTVLQPPRHQVKRGETYLLNNRHLLVVMCPVESVSEWKRFLSSDTTPIDLFCPYPGPYVPLSEEAKIKSLLLVQPDTFIAGHILDSYEAVYGKTSVAKAET